MTEGKRAIILAVALVALLLVGAGIYLLASGQQENPATAASDTTAQQSLDAEESQDDEAAAESSSQETSQGVSDASSQDASPDSNTDAGSGSQASASRAGNSKGSASADSTSDATLTVTVSIDASRAGSSYSSISVGAKSIALDEGATVFDALEATGVAISGDATYVSSISGLAERQCGALSGWMYSVNGEFPSISCGDYRLSQGDVVLWVYTCNMGEDL